MRFRERDRSGHFNLVLDQTCNNTVEYSIDSTYIHYTSCTYNAFSQLSSHAPHIVFFTSSPFTHVQFSDILVDALPLGEALLDGRGDGRGDRDGDMASWSDDVSKRQFWSPGM